MEDSDAAAFREMGDDAANEIESPRTRRLDYEGTFAEWAASRARDLREWELEMYGVDED